MDSLPVWEGELFRSRLVQMMGVERAAGTNPGSFVILDTNVPKNSLQTSFRYSKIRNCICSTALMRSTTRLSVASGTSANAKSIFNENASDVEVGGINEKLNLWNFRLDVALDENLVLS